MNTLRQSEAVGGSMNEAGRTMVEVSVEVRSGKARLSSGSALSPETTKVSGPSGVTESPAFHFRFSSPDPKATFECGLDGGAYYQCSPPENINGLSEGRHVFAVRAVDEQSNVDPSPAEWSWAVDRKE